MNKHSVTITEFNDIGEPYHSFHHQLLDDTIFVVSIGNKHFSIDTSTGEVKPYSNIHIKEHNECEKLISRTKSFYKGFKPDAPDMMLFGKEELLDLIPKLYSISPFKLVETPTTLLAYKDENEKIHTKGFSSSERIIFQVVTSDVHDKLGNYSKILDDIKQIFFDNYLEASLKEYENLTTNKTPYLRSIKFLIYPEGDKNWLVYHFAVIIKGFFRDNELNYL